jgi:hypothetical protein
LLVDDFFVGQWLSERLGQQFIVDNRPGAGCNIGVETLVRAPADGYTLLLACASSAINATLFDKLNYDLFATWRRKRPILWALITRQFPRLCRGGGKSLTYSAVVQR